MASNKKSGIYMPDPRKIAGLALVLMVFFGPVAYFSDKPVWRAAPAGAAQIKISFAHAGAREVACRRRTAAELSALAPNMRNLEDCSRRRVPLTFVMELDGLPAHEATLPPTGLSGDGPSRFYGVFPVSAGRHEITLKLRDSRRADGFDHVEHSIVDIAPGRNLAIDFRPGAGGFTLY